MQIRRPNVSVGSRVFSQGAEKAQAVAHVTRGPEASPNTRRGGCWLLVRAHPPTTPVNVEPARRALMQALPAYVPDTYAPDTYAA